MAETQETVGEWIAVRREQLGLNQIELAEIIGVSSRTVSNIERGKNEVKSGTRARWEKALAWPPGSLTTAYLRMVRPETPEDQASAPRELQMTPRGHDWYEAEREWITKRFPPGADRDWLIDRFDRAEDAERTWERQYERLQDALDRMGRPG